MKTMIAFLKKELLGHFRTGKIYIFLGVFALLGVMNFGVSLITPWLYEILEESMAATGMSMTSVTVTALDCWGQFYKNLLMGVIAFVVIESGIFTGEYRSGSLVLSLTKGLARYKVLIAKTVVMVGAWTVGYALCLGITYISADIFWDNSITNHLTFSLGCYWLFGLWIVSLIVFLSMVFRSTSAVLLTTGGLAFGMYLIGSLPKIGDYLPTKLANGAVLVYGLADPKDYTTALVITVILTIAAFSASIPLFNNKEI